ncbi:MAG: SapC family protein [Candidatus Methylumidiphilus sp.]
MSENVQPTNENVSLLFYRQVSTLHPDRHGELKIGAAPDQSFAAKTNSVPLTGVEFAEAGKEYPIVFSRAGENTFSPVAVLGLENGENLFLDENAAWKASYIPAFVRRYPFVLGENAENPSQPWVCVDESCPWLGNDTGEPLFIGKQPSAYMKQVLEFLTDYNLQSQRSMAFCRKLQDWGLFKENQVQATTPEGKSYTLSGLWVIDENALRQLEADKIQELFKTGELAWIFFHLSSLTNFRRLTERKNAKSAALSHLH